MASDPLEMAWKMHTALVEWIGKADLKASFSFTLQSVTLILMGTLTKTGKLTILPGSGVSQVLLWVGVIFMAGGSWCAAATIAPKLHTERLGQDEREDFLFSAICGSRPRKILRQYCGNQIPYLRCPDNW